MKEDYLLNKRILLVDDEQALLDLVLSILKDYGFQNIKTAKNVKEAMEQAEEILKAGKDRDGIFYSVYTWACLMYFVSGLWR